MITGGDSELLYVMAYHSKKELEEIVKNFLKQQS